MTKRITMLAAIQGGAAYGQLGQGGVFTVDDALAAELVNRAVAVFTDPVLPAGPAGVVFVGYYTTAQFALLVTGVLGLIYQVTDAAGRPQYRWNGTAFVAIGVALPAAVAFAVAVLLDGNSDMGQYAITGPLTFSVGAAQANGGQNHVTLLPNGVDVPNVTAFTLFGGSAAYSQSNVMELYFEFVNGRAYAGFQQGPVFVPAPTQVTGLTAGVATNSTQPLSWSLPAGGTPTDYIIEYKPSASSTWVVFPDGVSTALSTLVTGLAASTSYDYRVSASNASGTGPVSAAVTSITAAAGVVYAYVANNSSYVGTGAAQQVGLTISAGQRVFAIFDQQTSGNDVASCTDDAVPPNVYTKVGVSAVVGSYTKTLWTTVAAHAATTITGTSPAANATGGYASAVTYTGLAGALQAATPFAANGVIGTESTGSITPAGQPGMFFGSFWDAFNISTPSVGAGFTKRVLGGVPPGGAFLEDLRATSLAAATVSVSTTAAGNPLLLCGCFVQEA